MVKLVVGLGNPGPRYAGTRHNVGFDVIDVLGDRWSIGLLRERFHAWFGDGTIREQRVLLMKPSTFMNRSGSAVMAAGRFYQLEKEDLLVILDDLALPLGQIRVRPAGSAGSHRGLQDIIDRTGFTDFARVRIGIGEAVGNPADYVTTRFAEPERPIIGRAAATAADAAECWLEHGPEVAMNRFNRRIETD